MISDKKDIIQQDGLALSTYTVTDTDLIDKCVEEIKDKLLEYPKIMLYGKQATQHRCIGFFSDESKGYYYSRQLAKSIPLDDHMKTLLERVNSELHANFNGILVNYYKDGNDYISAHSDDEKDIDLTGVVAISVGAVRKFRIRNKKDRKIVIDLATESYGMIQMSGNFQKEFLHEIPVERKVKEGRYSFTFRRHSE